MEAQFHLVTPNVIWPVFIIEMLSTILDITDNQKSQT